jgi:NADPH:quinone reductase-like Zn-dependent oxidoreductase
LTSALGGVTGSTDRIDLSAAHTDLLADVMAREGVLRKRRPLPFTPGWDRLGVVDRLGDGVSGIEPGQIVAALPISGAYSELVCLPQLDLVPVPSGLDAAEAVSPGGIPIDFKHQDFVEEVRRLTSEGVAVVFDHIGGIHLRNSRKPLRPGGTVVGYGLISSLRG